MTGLIVLAVLALVVPVVDRMLPKTDLREQVVAFQPQAVITNDNVGMQISTVVYYQVVDARAAEYEVANFHLALEQITQTTLRNVIGNLILDKTLTSRDEINAKLRTVLDEVTEKWGIRVTRVELKEIIPPRDIQQAMEKQMQAERTRRASILTAEGDKRSAILKAEGEKESSILRAEGEQRSAVLRAEGEAEAYRNVQAAQIEMTGKLFERLESSDLSPESPPSPAKTAHRAKGSNAVCRLEKQILTASFQPDGRIRCSRKEVFDLF